MSEQPEPYICRDCDWTGDEPKIHTWHEDELPMFLRDTSGYEQHTRRRAFSAFSGSMKNCPECNKHVMTQSEWESDDLKEKWIPIIAFGIMGALVVFLVSLELLV